MKLVVARRRKIVELLCKVAVIGSCFFYLYATKIHSVTQSYLQAAIPPDKPLEMPIVADDVSDDILPATISSGTSSKPIAENDVSDDILTAQQQRQTDKLNQRAQLARQEAYKQHRKQVVKFVKDKLWERAREAYEKAIAYGNADPALAKLRSKIGFVGYFECKQPKIIDTKQKLLEMEFVNSDKQSISGITVYIVLQSSQTIDKLIDFKRLKKKKKFFGARIPRLTPGTHCRKRISLNLPEQKCKFRIILRKDKSLIKKYDFSIDGKTFAIRRLVQH